MKRTISILGILVVGVSLVLAGSVMAQTTLTITVHSSPVKKLQSEKFIPTFEKLNPDIKVKLHVIPSAEVHDKVTISLIGESATDVITGYYRWFKEWGAKELVKNLQKYVYQVNRADFYDSPWENASYNGNPYGIPHRYDIEGMVYNKRMFKEAGLDPEDPPQNWEELVEYGKALTISAEQYGFGLIGGDRPHCMVQLTSFVHQSGGRFLSKDFSKVTVNKPEAVRGIKFWVDLLRKHKIAPKGATEYDDLDIIHMFEAGKVAMLYIGPWFWDWIDRDVPEMAPHIASAVLPKGPVQRSATSKGWASGISWHTEHEKEAWRWIHWFTSSGVMAEFCRSLPPRKSAAQHPRFQTSRLKPYVKSLAFGMSQPPIPEWVEMTIPLYEQVQAALLGQKSVQEAMNDAVALMEKILTR